MREVRQIYQFAEAIEKIGLVTAFNDEKHVEEIIRYE